MPAYMHGLRLLPVPFASGPLTEAVNPIKLREYLAAGRPVVSTPMPEVERYAPAVRLRGTTAGMGRRRCAPRSTTDEERGAPRAASGGRRTRAGTPSPRAVEAVLDRLLPDTGQDRSLGLRDDVVDVVLLHVGPHRQPQQPAADGVRDRELAVRAAVRPAAGAECSGT